jgi:hypothetical protein
MLLNTDSLCKKKTFSAEKSWDLVGCAAQTAATTTGNSGLRKTTYILHEFLFALGAGSSAWFLGR